MALANFFKRAEQSLVQVLKSVEPGLLEERLKSISVAVAFDDQALLIPNSIITLRMAVNIMARLYPRLGIVFSGTTSAGFSAHKELMILAHEINPEIESLDSGSQYTVALCIGEPRIKADKMVYMSSDSWNLEVQINRPADTIFGEILNPFSASAVSCFGTSEVFTTVFPDVPLLHKSSGFVLSLLDYQKRPSERLELPPVHFKDLTMVGLGAIANATIWVLQYIPQLSGSITLIDPEKVDLTNLQRYALTNQESNGLLKVDLALNRLSRKGLNIHPFPLYFGNYVSKYRPNCDFDLIAVSVDNAETRIASQAVLPRTVINGWTSENGYLGLSQHIFNGQQACLACMYISSSKRKSRTEEIAEIIGYDREKTAEMYVKQIPLTKQFLEEISKSKGYPLDVLLRWEGKSLDVFFRYKC